MTYVKICGVTSVEDALMCVDAGADAIGLNFVAASPRCLTLTAAAEIARALPERVLSVGVFVDADVETLTRVKQAVGLRCLQLHGAEPPEVLERFLPHAYKAFRVQGPEILQEVLRYAGEYVLLDTYVAHAHGGTGERFDWELAKTVATVRKLTLAGGLRPDNVAEAVASVRPFCVDVASGVERVAGKKDPALVRDFIRSAKSVQQA